MGFLDLFTKSSSKLTRLPGGSFTVDRAGQIVVSTLSRDFSDTHAKRIGQIVLATFRTAQSANLHLSELVIEYAALKITARELRGGAMVFLTPRTSHSSKP